MIFKDWLGGQGLHRDEPIQLEKTDTSDEQILLQDCAGKVFHTQKLVCFFQLYQLV